ncbi:MmcQ/YjbR family DNA-binding protein [Halomonas kalidii]|uniref:MmcQ/YjbR family DNA-binding protein n=1 Tax=Halomonas kalidii TaxID=3043293 RepID=A0ABT6VNV1_9GAMM|nr:MmcQ/YjbR family DNA-binding protein [Halomonas kalidii]MDI5935675.1 MmcQ/YjbR family DNA-binding protein [Halomonas kalidii]
MLDTDFRMLAMGLPGAVEHAHMNHPDFRVSGKIFASLGYPDDAWGTVMLTPEEQQHFIAENPEGFQPAPGEWGKQGCTSVHLASVDHHQVRAALIAAWRDKAPRRMTEHFQE